MSSMVRNSFASFLAMLAIPYSSNQAQANPGQTAQGQADLGQANLGQADLGLMGEDGRQWDTARAAVQALPPGNMVEVIARWKLLNASPARYGFSDYAGLIMAYPGLPNQARLQLSAEAALERQALPASQIAEYFFRFPPVSNSGMAQFALALFALGRPEATVMALKAWRGGVMSAAAEAGLLARLGASLRPEDQDARMEALLWAGATAQAQRQISAVSPLRHAEYSARLAMIGGQDPAPVGAIAEAQVLSRPGYLYSRARMLRGAGQGQAAVSLLADHPPLVELPLDPRKWVGELLAAARRGDADSAVKIAATIDEMFPPGTQVSNQPYPIRDDYTSLMWLGGTRALWSLGDGLRAAPLFWRYGQAARTPQTRAKGFYWAGRALLRAGRAEEAQGYFEQAGQYPDQFYGLLALERLGRAIPALDKSLGSAPPTPEQRAAFNARPLTQAVREVARESDWPTANRFFKEIAEQADSEVDHLLVASLALELGRRDLGVILSQAAHSDGHGIYRRAGYPIIPVPPGTNWTFIHAISRQESQFAMNALSHAGARGLMQLMPATAREQAGRLGLQFDPRALTLDAGYNLTIGDAYFRRLLDYFGGCYPLAVAAYNAGLGNVNRWLRDAGDPRTGTIDVIDWIERIPLSETRNYVQRVLENAVVYEAMNPQRASYRGANPLSHFLGKALPG